LKIAEIPNLFEFPLSFYDPPKLLFSSGVIFFAWAFSFSTRIFPNTSHTFNPDVTTAIVWTTYYSPFSTIPTSAIQKHPPLRDFPSRLRLRLSDLDDLFAVKKETFLLEVFESDRS